MIPRCLIPILLLPLALAGAPTLEQIVVDPQLWPAEVTVTAATRGTVIRDGAPAGIMLVGAGRKLTVTAITTDGITGKLGGDMVKVPVERTDLLNGLGGTATAARQTAGVPAEPAVEERKASSGEAPGVIAPAASTRMQRHFAGKLVRHDGSRVQPVADQTLVGIKYYALYYSASWCGPCRKFTPGLVKAYRELKAKHPEFELVFVSADRSASAMADYMKADGMPWLAVKFDDVKRVPEIVRYSGPGIPCLVLVAADGRVLADSYDGDNYLGPQRALTETRRILAKGI